MVYEVILGSYVLTCYGRSRDCSPLHEGIETAGVKSVPVGDKGQETSIRRVDRSSSYAVLHIGLKPKTLVPEHTTVYCEGCW